MSGLLYLIATSHPRKHNPECIFWTISCGGGSMTLPISDASSSLTRPLSSGGICFVTQCSVSCISVHQASLEMKILGQIVFYARVGKEAVDKVGRSSLLPPEQTHSRRWEGGYTPEYHRTCTQTSVFRGRWHPYLTKTFLGGLAFSTSQNKAKNILFLELIFLIVITYLHPSLTTKKKSVIVYKYLY